MSGTTSSLGWANTTTTGSQSGVITLTGLSPGDDGSPQTATVSGAVVTQRSVTASPISLGRFMLTGGTGSSTLSTTGDDNDLTRITVNGTLFNSATTTSTYVLTTGTSTPGQVNSSVSLPITTAENGGAGLPGEGSYAPVVVSYTGTAVQNRVVTASTINIGRQMAGATVPGESGTTVLTSTGADNLFTRVTLGGNALQRHDDQRNGHGRRHRGGPGFQWLPHNSRTYR